MQDTRITYVQSRFLLGWLDEEEGALWLAGRDQSKIVPAVIAKVQRCRQAVSERPKIAEVHNPLTEPPIELASFIEKFWKQFDTKALHIEQWKVMIADLTKICAVQPNISTEQAKERLQGVNLNNLPELAEVSLPKTKETSIVLNLNESETAWIASSPNPNVRISACQTGSGFKIDLSSSFIQVAMCSGRFILRDGYHRAIGLLSENITHVPVLTKDFNTYTEMGMPAGLLPPEIIFGNNPPFLPDYLDDKVSAAANTPILQKIFVVA